MIIFLRGGCVGCAMGPENVGLEWIVDSAGTDSDGQENDYVLCISTLLVLKAKFLTW